MFVINLTAKGEKTEIFGRGRPGGGARLRFAVGAASWELEEKAWRRQISGRWI